MRAIVRSLLLFLLSVGPAGPAPAAEGLEAGESAGIAQVVDGDTVVLDRAIGAATEVRLVGIQAPKLPLGRLFSDYKSKLIDFSILQNYIQ